MFANRPLMLVPVLVTTALASLPLKAAGQCNGGMFEEHPPPAIRGMSTADPTLRVRYWAWDDLTRRRGGTDRPVLEDRAGGVLVSALDWVAADVCRVTGPVDRTALLLESLGDDGFGRWAVVNLGADPDGAIDVDLLQRGLGIPWSRTVPVPNVRIDELTVGSSSVDVDLQWELDSRGEALSDLVGADGEPLPSVRGYGVYVINGPVATPRPFDWTRARDVGSDAVNGYSTDTTATLRLPRSLWHDVSVCFAVALTFDGDGDADGELPGSRSVHGAYLGRPSRWVALPPSGIDLEVRILGLETRLLRPDLLGLWFRMPAEPAGASYRLWLRPASGRRVLLARFPGGAEGYEAALDLPRWCGSKPWVLDVELLDAEGRVVDMRSTVPSG